MKIAIIHDWLTNMGGAERIIRILHSLFPEAPIYTVVYDKENMPEDFRQMDIRTSFIQRMPFGVKKYQAYLPLMPTAVEQLDLREYDLVISSSTACAKGVLTRSDAIHLCYCNTPMRYAWDMYHEYVEKKGTLTKAAIAILMNYIRLWDRLSADRVDYFIANSHNVANRIKKHYRRDAKVIYPPVDTDYYTPSNNIDTYYLIVSRLVPYKRVDLAVEVFNELGLPLIVIGEGSELETYQKRAKSNITFYGRLSDEEVRQYYSRCKAFIFPGEEDFGIAPLEAQACGRPVIAYGKGGALETVVHGKTGIFFEQQNHDALKKAVLYMDNNISIFDTKEIQRHAARFSTQRFKSEILDFIAEIFKNIE